MVAEADGDLAGTEVALKAVETLIDERVTDPGTIASLAFGASWHAVRYGRPHASTAALAQRTEFALACGATLAAVYTTAATLAVACEADPPDHQLIRRLLSAAPPVDPAVANTAQFMVGELLALGRPGEASALVERLRHYADSLGALVLQARSARLAAVVAREGGDLHRARREAVVAASLLDVDRHVIEAIDVLEVSAGLQAAISPRSAAQAWGAIATLRRDREYRWLGVTERLHRRADELLVSTALGEDGYRASFAAGEQLGVRGALGVATHGFGGRGADAVGWESLTPTERQVARFVAGGDTNAEVAKRLLMGTETVKTHLKHVYLKLGLRSRTELAARARETGGSAE
jgi:DNA-binding CsgD family transcriptional regulator